MNRLIRKNKVQCLKSPTVKTREGQREYRYLCRDQRGSEKEGVHVFMVAPSSYYDRVTYRTTLII